MNETNKKQGTASNAPLPSWKNHVINWLTPLVETVLTQPLYIIKINRQQNLPIPRSIRGLYKGLTINALSFVPTIFVQMSVKKQLEQDVFSNTPTQTQKMAAALLAGVSSSIFIGSVELLTTKQNNMPHLSLTDAFQTHIKAHGLSGLFIGQMATACREGLFAVFFLAITPLLKAKIKPYCNHDATATTIAGVSSGLLGSWVTQPIDAIKTKQQVGSFHLNNLGFFQTAKNIHFSHLWHGLWPRSMTLILSITFMSWFQETLEQYCLVEDTHHVEKSI